jgi:hypothetical protein
MQRLTSVDRDHGKSQSIEPIDHFIFHRPTDPRTPPPPPTTSQPQPNNPSVKTAYAKVTGVYTNGKSAECTYWWEGITADYQTFSKYPPLVMLTPQATVGAAEAVNFDFVLPAALNEGVTMVSGGTGKMTGCQLMDKDLVAAIAGVAAGASTTTTTTAPAAETPVTADKAAEAEAVPVAEAEELPEPVAGDAPEVKETGMTSPAAGRAAASWGLGAAVVAAAVAGLAM